MWTVNTDTVNTLHRVESIVFTSAAQAATASNPHHGGSLASTNTLANPTMVKGSNPHFRARQVTTYPWPPKQLVKDSHLAMELVWPCQKWATAQPLATELSKMHCATKTDTSNKADDLLLLLKKVGCSGPLKWIWHHLHHSTQV